MTSEKKKFLMDKLKAIWDDKDFVCGTLSNCVSEKAWEVLLDYIETAENEGQQPTSDEILLLSLDLGDEFARDGISGRRKIAAALF